MENFNLETKIIVSNEFSELVSLATHGKFIPVADSDAKIQSVISQPSGQTLFLVSFKAETDDPNNDDDDENDEPIVVETQFPATVAQVQKMHKLAKKRDKENGVVPPQPVVTNTVKPVKVEVEDYDPFADAPQDF